MVPLPVASPERALPRSASTRFPVSPAAAGLLGATPAPDPLGVAEPILAGAAGFDAQSAALLFCWRPLSTCPSL